MGGSFRLFARLVAIALGVAALTVHPSAQWVEMHYANGGYPVWEHTHLSVHATPCRGRSATLPHWLGVAVVVWRIIVYWRRAASSHRAEDRADRFRSRCYRRRLFHAGSKSSWGWNYDRAPIEARLAYDAARVLRTRSMRCARSQSHG